MSYSPRGVAVVIAPWNFPLAIPTGMVTAALGQVELALPQMRQLPRQLVHGDIGPDNVLMHGSEVIAIKRL